MRKEPVYVSEFKDWESTVAKLLDKSGLINKLQASYPVLIKPNLVTVDKPPITTPVGIIEAIVQYLRKNKPELKLIVAEGCGASEYDTWTPFRELGYVAMAEKYDVELVDLNTADLLKFENPDCSRWPVMYLPELVMNSFLLSVPVLKAHSLAEVTLTMKNMMGLAPPKHYNAGSWQKSAFHQGVQDAIFDLNRYRTPDFTVLDATVGMQMAHLWGPTCDPEPNLVAASWDPVAIDAYGTEVLNKDWRNIAHITMADGVLGSAEASEIITL